MSKIAVYYSFNSCAIEHLFSPIIRRCQPLPPYNQPHKPLPFCSTALRKANLKAFDIYHTITT